MKSLFSIAAHGSAMHVVSATKLTAGAGIKAAIDKAVTTVQEKLEAIQELASALNLWALDDNADLRALETLLDDLQDPAADYVEILRAAGFKSDFDFRMAPVKDNTVVVGAYRYLVQEQ